MALNKRQRLFVAEYLIDFNAQQAYIRAGYSPIGAGQAGFKLLNSAEVADEIEKAVEARRMRAQRTQDEIVAEIERIAFFDLGKLVDEEDKPLPLSQVDEDTRRALAGLEISDLIEDRVLAGYVKKYKVTDKMRALEALCKIHGFNAPEKINATVAAVTLTEHERRAEALKLLEQGRLRAKP